MWKKILLKNELHLRNIAILKDYKTKKVETATKNQKYDLQCQNVYQAFFPGPQLSSFKETQTF